MSTSQSQSQAMAGHSHSTHFGQQDESFSYPGALERRSAPRTVAQRAKFHGARSARVGLIGYTVGVLVLCVLKAVFG
jgi:hypothetical protein